MPIDPMDTTYLLRYSDTHCGQHYYFVLSQDIYMFHSEDDGGQSPIEIGIGDAPARDAAYHEDILRHIATHLDWPSLMAIRHCPEPSPTIVADEAKYRIFAAVRKYIPDESIVDFFRNLTRCQGAIVGPVVQGIIQHEGTNPCVNPRDLRILTPRGCGGPMFDFLRGIGYTFPPEDETNDSPWAPDIAHIEHLSKITMDYSQVSKSSSIARIHRSS